MESQPPLYALPPTPAPSSAPYLKVRERLFSLVERGLGLPLTLIWEPQGGMRSLGPLSHPFWLALVESPLWREILPPALPSLAPDPLRRLELTGPLYFGIYPLETVLAGPAYLLVGPWGGSEPEASCLEALGRWTGWTEERLRASWPALPLEPPPCLAKGTLETLGALLEGIEEWREQQHTEREMMNHLYQQALRQLEELEALQEIGHSLNSSVNMAQTLEKVLQCASSLLKAQSVAILLKEEGSPYMHIRASCGLDPQTVAQTRIKLGEHVPGRVALNGQSLSLPPSVDTQGQEREAALCVPLNVDHKVIGVLSIRAKAGGSPFNSDDLHLAHRLASMSAAALENADLHQRLRQLLLESITALANAIDARDPYTHGHSERVAKLAVAVGERLNFTEQEIWDLRHAALLHDIGKIRVPDEILNKPQALDDAEYAEMQRHTIYGAAIMRPVQSFRHLAPSILHHHERYDGQGYPEHLQGEEIPLAARIISLVDSFDAMVTDRPYRKGMEPRQALEIICAQSGRQFDPRLVEVFAQLFREGKLLPLEELSYAP